MRKSVINDSLKSKFRNSGSEEDSSSGNSLILDVSVHLNHNKACEKRDSETQMEFQPEFNPVEIKNAES
jgi:hypothetical protein